MKLSTVVRPIVAALSVPQVFGKGVTRDEGFKAYTREVDTTETQDKAPEQNTTDLVPGIHMYPEGTTMDMLDLENEGNYTIINDTVTPYDWVIPVTHMGCTGWILRQSDITDSIQKLVDWSLRGGVVVGKGLHIEMTGATGAFACNCKWNYDDHLPESEMREFYERLTMWCGHGRSGWIFSKKWEKGYAVASKFWIKSKKPIRFVCPAYCAYKNRFM
ncbi:hypothetical protein F5Y13DRAFT_143958 [Hypoxylon sp. FL1857]|nr:hypothetical protein F5Y13DRAFT_143958 [Hypoxylon sp. FL1857]